MRRDLQRSAGGCMAASSPLLPAPFLRKDRLLPRSAPPVIARHARLAYPAETGDQEGRRRARHSMGNGTRGAWTADQAADGRSSPGRERHSRSAGKPLFVAAASRQLLLTTHHNACRSRQPSDARSRARDSLEAAPSAALCVFLYKHLLTRRRRTVLPLRAARTSQVVISVRSDHFAGIPSLA